MTNNSFCYAMSFRGGRIAITFAVFLSTLAFLSPVARAQTFSMLYTFNGAPDGNSPWGAPVSDSHGNLYGTTWSGGLYGFGTVFKLDTAGNQNTLHNFAGGSDGANPWAGLIRDSAGNLYGTTYWGGGPHCFNNYGCGTVFSVSPDRKGGWTERVLYSFTGGKRDGQYPGYGSLARDKAGNLYGTTIYGGIGYCSSGCGVVFKVSSTGTETLLHKFKGTDGGTPYGGLIRDSAGNLYGTTEAGGPSPCACGVVFKLTSAGKEAVLYSFAGYPQDGSQPMAGVVRDGNGNLYGTTWSGGTAGYGTVFKLDPTGTETVLHSFIGYPSDGTRPVAGVVRDPAGNLYGTTYYGGNGSGGGFCETNGQTQGCATLFKVDTNSVESVLHNFNYDVDGAEITAGLFRDKSGNLYGAASVGGPTPIHGGTIFKLTP